MYALFETINHDETQLNVLNNAKQQETRKDESFFDVFMTNLIKIDRKYA